MKRDPSADDLGRWTLAPDERLLIFARTSASGLGFAALLKFFQAEGRFPWYPQEVPHAAIEYLARQTGLDLEPRPSLSPAPADVGCLLYQI